MGLLILVSNLLSGSTRLGECVSDLLKERAKSNSQHFKANRWRKHIWTSGFHNVWKNLFGSKRIPPETLPPFTRPREWTIQGPHVDDWAAFDFYYTKILQNILESIWEHLRKIFVHIWTPKTCQIWKRRAPKHDEDPSKNFLKILNMGPIST